jgi:hypothetical protein
MERTIDVNLYSCFLLEKIHRPNARFEIFTAVKAHIEVFCVVMSCSVMGGYHRFGAYLLYGMRI